MIVLVASQLSVVFCHHHKEIVETMHVKNKIIFLAKHQSYTLPKKESFLFFYTANFNFFFLEFFSSFFLKKTYFSFELHFFKNTPYKNWEFA